VYRFGHALVRDVLYKKLGAGERAARHLRIGEKLLAHYGEAADAHAAELTYHFARALPCGDAGRTVGFALRAAEHLVARGADEQAIKYWSEAVRASTFLRGDATQRLTAQIGLGRSLVRIGRGAEAREAFLDAALVSRTLGHAEFLAQAERELSVTNAEEAPRERKEEPSR
jgi:predicted ATPase